MGSECFYCLTEKKSEQKSAAPRPVKRNPILDTC